MKKTMKRRHLGIFALATTILCGVALTGCGEGNPSQGQVGPVELTGQGAPFDSLGKDGDTYRDTLTNELYKKENGKWVKQETIIEGNGIPSDSFGEDGLLFKDVTTGDIYEKQNGKWILIQEGDLIAKHAVTIDLNGGNIDGEISVGPIYVRHNSLLPVLRDPQKAHTKFTGWVTENNGQQFAYNFDLPVLKDFTLVATYAVDEESKIVITVDPNNGEAPYTKETFDGDTLRIVAPTKDGYDFAGWFFEDTGEMFTGTVRPNHNNRKIVAKWVKAQFNFIYSVELNGEATITGLRDRNTVIFNCPEEVDGHKITKIADTAFQSFIKLTHISLPSGLTYLNPRAFIGDRALQEVTIAPANTAFTSVEGVVYTKDMKTIVYCPPKNTQGSFKIPESVTTIGHHSFYGHQNEGVSSIEFPSKLETIEERAFYDNRSITSVKFPATLKTIGEAAFCSLTAGVLQKIDFNEGLETIGEMAFGGQYIKDSLRLPSTVKTIGQYAFVNCTAITEVTLPKDLTDLQPNAFNGCTGILRVSVDINNKTYKLIDNVVYDYDVKTAIFCPSGNRNPVVIPEGVTEIREAAFYMCDNTTEYTFPSTLKKIGYRAFAECYDLRTFTIPDSVTEIGEDLFTGCSKLIEINIGKGIKAIPSYTFSNCISLRNVTIPSNILEIGTNAFFGCPIEKITFEEGIQKIGDGAFYYTQQYDEEIASGPTEGPLTSLQLPNSLLEIGDRAFAGHKKLAKIQIGDNLKEFNVHAFEEKSLMTVSVSQNNQHLKVLNSIVYSKDGKKIYFAALSVSGDIAIDTNVETIGEYAFYDNEITSVELHDGLKVIGDGAFKTNNITSLDIPGSVTILGNEAFYSNDNLTTIKFNEGLETIGDDCFIFSSKLSSVTLPNSLKTLGNDAFKLCSSLTSVTFGNSLETIGAEAFNRTSLTGVINIPASVTSIGEQAFFSDSLVTQSLITDFNVDPANKKYVGENGLLMDKERTIIHAYAAGNEQTSLTLPSTIKEIGSNGLAYATKLKTLTLNEGLEVIGDYGLKSVSNVEVINIPASVKYVGKEAFSGLRVTQTINFNCTREYAIKNFYEYFDLSCKATLVFAGEGSEE